MALKRKSTPPPPVTTGKFRDRLLAEAERYQEGRISEMELLRRIDDILELVQKEHTNGK